MKLIVKNHGKTNISYSFEYPYIKYHNRVLEYYLRKPEMLSEQPVGGYYLQPGDEFYLEDE